MPLASELTTELTTWLTPQKLRTLNESWRSRGGGYSTQVIDDFVPVLSRLDQNYETLIGHLEVQSQRDSQNEQGYYGLHAWLVEMVYHLLYYRHVNNPLYIQRQVPYYQGLCSLVENNRPLWVFSLNHDLIIECIASYYHLPLSVGFNDEVVTLPRSRSGGGLPDALRAEVLLGQHLPSRAMPFLPPDTRGINLLKLHGGLDIFTFRDGKDLLRILPLDDSIDGILGSLRSANEDLSVSRDVFPTNEIAYADHAGVVQFLRRSILSGVFKFDPRTHQVLPRNLLQHFKTYLNSLQTLVCIGYRFGDEHINTILRRWLETTPSRRLLLVGPSAKSVPPPLLHLAPQIDVRPLTATDYLDQCAQIRRSEPESNLKKFTAYSRGRGKAAAKELQAFVRERRTARLRERIAELASLGEAASVESLTVPPKTLLEELNHMRTTPDEILADFVKEKGL